MSASAHQFVHKTSRFAGLFYLQRTFYFRFCCCCCFLSLGGWNFSYFIWNGMNYANHAFRIWFYLCVCVYTKNSLYVVTAVIFRFCYIRLSLSLSRSSNGNWWCMLPLFYDDLIIFFTTHNYTHRHTCWIYCPYTGQKYANKCCNQIHFINERTEIFGFVTWIFLNRKLIETLEFHATWNETNQLFSWIYCHLIKCCTYRWKMI